MGTVNPGTGADLTDKLDRLYSELELRLLATIRDHARRGLETRYYLDRVAEIQALRVRLAEQIRAATRPVAGMVQDIYTQAWDAGVSGALTQLPATPVAPALTTALVRIVEDTLTRLDRLPPVVLRRVTDAYQAAAVQPVAALTAGHITVEGAMRDMLGQLAKRGLTAFVDRAGRAWSLDAYARMVVRTGAGQAATQGHLDTLAAGGHDLVIVSDAPRECELCTPWEQKVLAIQGPAGRRLVDGPFGPVKVTVEATVDAARAAGLQHPNCRHSLSLYLPGVTQPRVPETSPELYRAAQHQRSLERRVRAWKRQAATALNPGDENTAKARIRHYQARLRDHTARYGLPRRYPLEQPR